MTDENQASLFKQGYKEVSKGIFEPQPLSEMFPFFKNHYQILITKMQNKVIHYNQIASIKKKKQEKNNRPNMEYLICSTMVICCI